MGAGRIRLTRCKNTTFMVQYAKER